MTQHLSRRFLLLSFTGLTLSACETLDPSILDGILGSGILTQGEAAQGIRAALSNGVTYAVQNTGRTDGFLLSDIIHIPLPRQLQDIQSILQPLGAGRLLSDLEVQLNRGAEAAVPVAKDIFLDVISGLTVQDAIGIVQGSQTAATDYLRERTTPRLTSLFSPIMENALAQTGALRLFDQVVQSMDRVPFGAKLGADAKSDLIAHGVDYSLSGVFHFIAEEERLIRENPAKRTSEILRRVFGGQSSII